jgi:hypothetical protein
VKEAVVMCGHAQMRPQAYEVDVGRVCGFVNNKVAMRTRETSKYVRIGVVNRSPIDASLTVPSTLL